MSKVPEVTLVFWIIKIAATTLGETGGDTVSMSMNLGYLVGSAIFAAIFIVAVRRRSGQPLSPWLYWTTIIATTMVGTTLADFADRSLGIGYAGGSSLLFILLMASLALWHWSLGSVSIHTVSSRRAEMFYWITIMFSRPSAPRWETGPPIPRTWATPAPPGVRAAVWHWWRRPISGPASPGRAVLDGIHPHPAARGGGGRFPG